MRPLDRVFLTVVVVALVVLAFALVASHLPGDGGTPIPSHTPGAAVYIPAAPAAAIPATGTTATASDVIVEAPEPPPVIGCIYPDAEPYGTGLECWWTTHAVLGDYDLKGRKCPTVAEEDAALARVLKSAAWVQTFRRETLSMADRAARRQRLEDAR